MSYQPIVISREDALRELQPYILRSRPLVHSRFDRRLRALNESMGDAVIQAGHRINDVISSLRTLREIAIAQREFVLHQSRNTANTGVPQNPPTANNQPTNRRRGQRAGTQGPPAVRSWLTVAGMRRLVICLVPYINHRLVMETGNTTGIPSQCTDLLTDSWEAIRTIHAENAHVTTINANYRDQSRRVALTHYSERTNDVLQKLRDFEANASFIIHAVNNDAQRLSSLATAFIQEQPGRPTSTLDILIRRLGETINQMRTRRGNILNLTTGLEYGRLHGWDPEETINVDEANIHNRIDNPDAVIINWNHQDLIPIRYLPGEPSINHDPIDPIFAVAVTRFLKYIKHYLQVVEVYTAGFIRNPIHLNDPHPFGRSWDVTGFKVNLCACVGPNRSWQRYAILHLRGGYPVTNLRTDVRDTQRAGTSDLSNYRRGPSDWFNIASIFENTYRETNRSDVPLPFNARCMRLRNIIGAMPTFFGYVKGPGSDIQHMDHFHVDLIRASYSAPSMNCPATMANPTPFIPAPRSRAAQQAAARERRR